MDQLAMWTLAIAVGGLVIAVISLGGNIYLHTTSRPKIQVTASIMRMHPTPVGLSEDTEVLILEAVNVRSRPVTIRGFYGKLREPEDNKSHFWLNGSCKELASYASTLPHQVKEGDVAQLMILVDAIDNLENVEFFYATDTTGRNWVSSKHPLRQQLENSREQVE